MVRYVPSTLLLIAIYCVHARESITISDNGYDGIVVAIHKDVTEHRILIEKIKDVFTEASAFLYRATKHRVYFRNITILVPARWSEDLGYRMATTETYETAHFRVDKKGTAGDRPYARQIDCCGKPGLYVQMTETFFTNVSVPSNLGPLDKVVVHEWGHLRWGLFDEYTVDEDKSHFYLDSNELLPVACHSLISGSEPCSDRGADGLPLPECIFRADPEQPVDWIKSSIMFAQWIKSVEEFCHGDPSDPNGKHNRVPQNRQNVICDGRSAWEVMLNHSDFINGTNPTRVIDDTSPNFIIKRSEVRRVVLVLDTSGSMAGNRIQRLYQTATYFIDTKIEDGSFVGIVGFSSTAVILAGMTEIKYGFQRDDIASNVPQVVDGFTSIGAGLELALQVLENGNVASEGASLLLITDGAENRSPFIANVLPDIYDSGVRVDTFAYTESAQLILQNLSDTTGGLYFYVPDNDNSTAFIDSLAATITDNPLGNSDIIPITLESSVITLTTSEMTYEDTLFLDSSLGNRTVFSFIFLETVLDVALLSPTAVRIDKYYIGYSVHEEQRRVAIEIHGIAEAGIWTYIIYNTNGTSGIIKIILESRMQNEDDEPIRVLGRLSKTTLSYGTDPELVFRAEVRKGYSPVVGAQVIATVNTPNNGKVVLTLFDNGVGGDIIANDGVYSAYFLDYTPCGATCRYGVKINVRNTDGTAMIKSYETLNGALPMNQNIRRTSKLTTADLFTRTTSGGAFDVEGGPPAGTAPKDIYPPSRITDLKIEEQSYDNGTIRLTWTAVGDDYDRGRVDSYDLRRSTGVDELYDNFDNASLVTNDDLLVGNLSSPQVARSRESIVVIMNATHNNRTHAFSVRAIDTAGNQGKPSNVVFTTFVYVPPVTSTVAPTSESDVLWPNTTLTTPRQNVTKSKLTTTALILIIVVSSIVVIALLCAIICCMQKRHTKGRFDLPI
ncbi:calcium-activated chloride channel regulator 1-like [Saccoglossus kowalevskii]